MSFTAQQHLHHRLTAAGHHTLSTADQAAIDSIGVEQFILSRLFSKKFRKQKLDPACLARTTQAVKTKLTTQSPLTVVYPQGGYKLWRLPSSPTADWAEFFAIAYVLEYLAPIAAVYKPGVEVVFYLHTLLMELHGNLTTEEIAAYGVSLQQLLDTFQEHCPKNIKLSILRDSDIYTREEYFPALENGKKAAVKDFATWSAERKANYRRTAELNIKWQGKERWDLLDEANHEDKLYQAALYEISGSYNLPKVQQKIKSPENILLFTKATPEFIGIGSTKTSVAKYWVGYGVLETDGERFYERVLTPSQWEHCQKTEYHTEKISLLDLPNFEEVQVFPRLNFAKA